MTNASEDEQAALAARLEAAEREIAELQAEKKQLEHRVLNANRTLAYGLGRAMIEARSFKGLMALPRKIRRLRLKQRAKTRERVPDTLPLGIAARLKLVDPALERLRIDGPGPAARWVREANAPDDARARALIELAFAIADDDPDRAVRLTEEAAALDRPAGRLSALLTHLQESGAAALRPDADAIALAKAEFGIEGEGVTIACVGTIVQEAGYEAFLDGFAALVRDGAAQRLAVIGGGEAPWLVAQAERRDLAERVHILGEPLALRWPPLLVAIDLLVYPRAMPEPPDSDTEAMGRIASAVGVRQLRCEAVGTDGWESALRSALAAPRPKADHPADLSGLLEETPMAERG